MTRTTPPVILFISSKIESSDLSFGIPPTNKRQLSTDFVTPIARPILFNEKQYQSTNHKTQFVNSHSKDQITFSNLILV